MANGDGEEEDMKELADTGNMHVEDKHGTVEVGYRIVVVVVITGIKAGGENNPK